MNRFIVGTVVCLMVFALTAAGAEMSVPVVKSEIVPAGKVPPSTVRPPDPGRGLINMMTFWLEVPRCIVYDNVHLYPGFGVVTGLVKGTVLGVARAGVGVVDALTLGYTENAMYEPDVFPDFVWQAPWY